MSSPDINAIHFPSANVIPTLEALLGPSFCLNTFFILESEYWSIFLLVLSIEPSSTIINSKSLNDWFKILSIAFFMNFSWL